MWKIGGPKKRRTDEARTSPASDICCMRKRSRLAEMAQSSYLLLLVFQKFRPS